MGEDFELHMHRLSMREREVLEHVAKGMSNKIIAIHLGISEKTVAAHLTSSYKKLGVSNRMQGALVAINGSLRDYVNVHPDGNIALKETDSLITQLCNTNDRLSAEVLYLRARLRELGEDTNNGENYVQTTSRG